MMHPQMIQNLLLESKLKENELSQRVFVPCLQKMSMLMQYAFRDVRFIGGTGELGVDPIYAGSQNVRINLFDPENPIELIKDFSSTEWTDISLADVIPPAHTDALFLAFYPHNGNLPGLEIAIKTTIDDLVIGSMMSQVNLIPIRIEKGQTSCRIKLLHPDKHTRIVCRGFRFTI